MKPDGASAAAAARIACCCASDTQRANQTRRRCRPPRFAAGGGSWRCGTDAGSVNRESDRMVSSSSGFSCQGFPNLRPTRKGEVNASLWRHRDVRVLGVSVNFLLRKIPWYQGKYQGISGQSRAVPLRRSKPDPALIHGACSWFMGHYQVEFNCCAALIVLGTFHAVRQLGNTVPKIEQAPNIICYSPSIQF